MLVLRFLLILTLYLQADFERGGWVSNLTRKIGSIWYVTPPLLPSFLLFIFPVLFPSFLFLFFLFERNNFKKKCKCQNKLLSAKFHLFSATGNFSDFHGTDFSVERWSILLVLRIKIYFCHPVGYFRHPAAPALIWVFSSRTSQKSPERPFWPILAVFAHFCTVFTEVSGFIRSVRFRLKCPISIESGHLPVFTPKNSKFEPFSVKKTIPFLIYTKSFGSLFS